MKIPLYVQTLMALVLGAFVGGISGEAIAPLGEVSKWIIELIKTVAMPLLFVTITEAIYTSQVKGSGVFALLGVATVNGLCAISIALLLTNLFHPGTYLPLNGTFLAKGFTQTELLSGITRSFTSNPRASVFSGTTLVIVLALVVGTV